MASAFKLAAYKLADMAKVAAVFWQGFMFIVFFLLILEILKSFSNLKDKIFHEHVKIKLNLYK